MPYCHYNMSAHGTALFALGRFWEVQDAFSRLEGVIATEAGYTGGTTGNPTFHTIGDHCEAVHISYDPRVISYEEMLELFWRLYKESDEHDSQYRPVVFYVDDHQRRAAENSKAAHNLEHPESNIVSIEPAGKFYPAEAYHQHYLAKLRGEEITQA